MCTDCWTISPYFGIKRPGAVSSGSDIRRHQRNNPKNLKMNMLLKVLALAVLVAAVSGRVLTGWPSALDEDFQDRVDMPEVQSEAREEGREEPVEVMLKQLEGRDFKLPKEAFDKQHDFEANDAGSDGQGYFQGFAPREIVLDDNQSMESRFAFPDFPKMDFPFDKPFGGERPQ